MLCIDNSFSVHCDRQMPALTRSFAKVAITLVSTARAESANIDESLELKPNFTENNTIYLK